jgi:hypothetical protein
MKVSLGGQDLTALATGQMGPWGIAVNSTGVYWANDNSVASFLFATQNTEILDADQAGAVALAVDTTNVYWTTGSGGTVMKIPLAGGAPTTLASKQDFPAAVAVDTTSVYWINSRAHLINPLSRK